MKHTFVKLLTVAVALIGGVAQADLLFDGGAFITHPAGMTGTVAGADRSAISPGGGTFGSGGNQPANVRIADDFVLANNSTITDLTFYAYTTGATTVTATGLTVRIWSGTPGTGTILFGDTVTNVLSTAIWEPGPSGLGVYRTNGTDTLGATRRVQQMKASGLNWNLAAGTYWVDFAYTGANFTPVLSSTTGVVAGNAIQSQDAGVTFAFNVLDGATIQTGLPFLVEGTQAAIPEPTAASLLVLGAAVLGLRRRR